MPTDPPDPAAVSSRADLAAALTRLRERAGLSVRDLARQVGTPPATLGGYFSGRHVPSPTQQPLLRAVFAACGVQDPAEIDAWLAALARARAASDRRRRDTTPPYRGLACFEAEDAPRFFGREAETAALIAAVRTALAAPAGIDRMVAAVGPSGSGKSSVLRAGLIAAVRAGALDAPDAHCVLTTPGAAPVERLGAALDELLAPPGPGARVLVVDQLEEILSAQLDPAVRNSYLDLLVQRPAGVVAVFGLRADFYAAAARQPALLPALQRHQVLVGPLGPAALRDTIVRPARQHGSSIEDGLADVILADLGQVGQPPGEATSALPLLGHALLATWERSAGGRMTIADYRATGGIHAAIERTAERVFAELTADEQRAARALFLRMVRVDDLALTRRRVTWAELDGGPDGRTRDVADRFVAERLLTASAEGLEPSHEALLGAWPRLRGWIDADRDALRLHRQITDHAQEWERGGRDPALLLRGARLEAALDFAADDRHRLTLTAGEQDYLDSGAAQARAERQLERRAARRIRQALVAVVVLAVVAIALAGVSWSARLGADRARAGATAARDRALAGRVAAQAARLAGHDPALAEQLALAAYRIDPTDAARGALVDQSAQPVVTRVLGVPGPTALATSPDGRVVAVGHADDGSIHLYRSRGAAPPSPLGTVPGPGAGHEVYALTFTADGRYLAAGGQGGRVVLWQVTDPARPRRVATLGPAFPGAVETLAVSPAGGELVAGGPGPHPVRAWRLRPGGGAPQPLSPPPGVPAGTVVQSLAFAPRGHLLAAGGSNGTLLLWPVSGSAEARPRALPAPAANTVNAVAFSPDAARLYDGDSGGRVIVWSTTGHAARLRTLTGGTDSPVNTLAVSPSGGEVAVGTSDDALHRFDTRTGETRGVEHNPGPVTGVRYSPDGTTLFSTAADGTLRTVRSTEGVLPVPTSVFALSFSRDGSRLAVGSNGAAGNVRVWDVRDRGRPEPVTAALRMPAGHPAVDGAAAISPDGRFVAAGNSAGQVQLWDLTDPASPRRAGAPLAASTGLVESLAFSPDGTLLAVGADDHAVHLVDVHDPAHPRLLAAVHGQDLMLSVAFSADGQMVAGANADHRAYVWDIGTPSRPHLVARLGGFRSYVYGVAFSPVGHLLAATSSDHTVRVWDVSTDRRPAAVGRPMIGATDYVYSAAFDPTGTRLATAGNDGAVRVYAVGRTASGLPQETLTALGDPVFAVAYSPDGSTLFAGGRTDSVLTWTTGVRRYAQQLCAAAGDPITRDEWALYVPGAPYDPPCRPRR